MLAAALAAVLLVTAWALSTVPSVGSAQMRPVPVPMPTSRPAPRPAPATLPRFGMPQPATAPQPRMGMPAAFGVPMMTSVRPIPAPAPAPRSAPPRRRKAKRDPLAGWGPPAAPQIDPRRFTEAHWQGLEVIPNTPQVARALKLPRDVPGVIVDDVTLPADLQGFQAGDLVTHVGQAPTPDLLRFIEATARLRDQPQAGMIIVRDGIYQAGTLVALMGRMGTANGETPSMIPPSARMPHPHRGACTNCHRIGTTGTLPVDQGDLIAQDPPAIRIGDSRPHQDRGPCTTCHQVLP